MEGVDVDGTLLPAEARTRRIIALTGWTYDQIDAAPARRLDWLLAMAAVEDEVRAASHG